MKLDVMHAGVGIELSSGERTAAAVSTVAILCGDTELKLAIDGYKFKQKFLGKECSKKVCSFFESAFIFNHSDEEI